MRRCYARQVARWSIRSPPSSPYPPRPRLAPTEGSGSRGSRDPSRQASYRETEEVPDRVRAQVWEFRRRSSHCAMAGPPPSAPVITPIVTPVRLQPPMVSGGPQTGRRDPAAHDSPLRHAEADALYGEGRGGPRPVAPDASRDRRSRRQPELAAVGGECAGERAGSPESEAARDDPLPDEPRATWRRCVCGHADSRSLGRGEGPPRSGRRQRARPVGRRVPVGDRRAERGPVRASSRSPEAPSSLPSTAIRAARNRAPTSARI